MNIRPRAKASNSGPGVIALVTPHTCKASPRYAKTSKWGIAKFSVSEFSVLPIILHQIVSKQKIYICIDCISSQRPFTWPLFVWLHIFMTWNEQLGATLLLSINHSCFPNHRWLHLSLSYLLLSSEKRCEVSLACSGLHDMICVSAYKSFSNEPCALSSPSPSSSKERRKRSYICKMTALMKNECLAHMALIRHRLICCATDSAHFLQNQTAVKNRKHLINCLVSQINKA